MKVVVGMSGGVDSSVAAYLLKKAGYDVEGVSLALYEARGGRKDICCSVEAVNAAGATARMLGIRHTVVNLREEFMGLVIEPFIEAYSKGLTPNPCILCNRHIKFPYLTKEAERRGAGFISTGHYAQVEDGLLKKGLDPAKDQSYALYVLREEELRRLVLPLGGLRKAGVRAMASKLGLPAAERPESQEICFVGDMKCNDFLSGLLPDSEGPVIGPEGNIIGRHKGLYRYTIGQRKRLGVSSPTPLYVTRIDPVENAVHVGPKEAALKREFKVSGINRLGQVAPTTGTAPISEGPVAPFRAGVRVRSMMKEAPATIHMDGEDSCRVVYDSPQWAPAPGQSAVFYEGETVLGGGVICL